MGYFKDAFDVGAGATLGNMAVNTGAHNRCYICRRKI